MTSVATILYPCASFHLACLFASLTHKLDNSQTKLFYFSHYHWLLKKTTSTHNLNILQPFSFFIFFVYFFHFTSMTLRYMCVRVLNHYDVIASAGSHRNVEISTAVKARSRRKKNGGRIVSVSPPVKNWTGSELNHLLLPGGAHSF